MAYGWQLMQRLAKIIGGRHLAALAWRSALTLARSIALAALA
jgi:hypothetical protein